MPPGAFLQDFSKHGVVLFHRLKVWIGVVYTSKTDVHILDSDISFSIEVYGIEVRSNLSYLIIREWDFEGILRVLIHFDFKL